MPGRAQRLGVAGRQEAVVALAGCAGCRARGCRARARPGARRGTPELTISHAAAEHALEQRRGSAGSACSRGSPCRPRPRAAGACSGAPRRRSAASNGEPRSISGTSSGQATAGDGHERVGRRDRPLVRAAGHGRLASPCSRRGRCASRPRPAPRRAARRRARRRRASSASAARAAPAAPPPTRELQATTSSLIRRASSSSATSSENASISSRGARPVRHPRGVGEVHEVLVRQLHEQLVQHRQPADAGVEHADGPTAQRVGRGRRDGGAATPPVWHGTRSPRPARRAHGPPPVHAPLVPPAASTSLADAVDRALELVDDRLRRSRCP